jgi:hypothetical protein
MVTELRVFASCRKRPPGTARRKHNATFSQLEQEQSMEAATPKAVHSRAAAWIATGVGTLEDLLKAQVCVN